MNSNLLELKIVVDVNKLNEKSTQDFVSISSKRVGADNSGQTSIKSLNLSNRTVNALIKEGISFKEQAQKLSIDDFMKMKGLGEKSLKELSKTLNIKYDKNVHKTSKTPAPATKNGGMMENFEDYNLSKRTITVLSNTGVTDPEELRAMSDNTIRSMKGAGSKTLDEISGVIKRKLDLPKNTPNKPSGKMNSSKSTLNLEFTNLGFSTRTLNQLSKNNIGSKKELLKLDLETIKSWKGAGKKVIAEIMKFQGKPVIEEKKNSSRGRPLKSVTEIGLKSKTIKVLTANGITTLKGLKSVDHDKFKEMEGVDKNVINDVKDIIGYKFENQTKQETTKTDVSCLNLPNKTAKTLISNGIKFVEDLKSKSDNDLKNIKGLGNSSVKKIHTALEKIA